jgi:sulfite exporter TauE/SafE
VSDSTAIYGLLLVSGLLGSLGHCLGMCGPLVLLVSLQHEARGWRGLPVHGLYHGARLAVYGLLGAIAGEVGSLLRVEDGFGRAAGIGSLVLGAGIVVAGLSYLGWSPLRRCTGAGAWWSAAMRRARSLGSRWGTVLLGALNGLLPCGLVYASLLVSASTASAWRGALGMVVFGLGTIPALLVVGLVGSAFGARARQAMSRLGGALVVLAGLQLVLRGSAALGWTPHLRLGEVMVW